MKWNITKRDITFFLLGMFTLSLVEIMFDFNGSINDFKRGFNEGVNKSKSQ